MHLKRGLVADTIRVICHSYRVSDFIEIRSAEKCASCRSFSRTHLVLYNLCVERASADSSRETSL